ncbi:hypothetical protein [Roseibium sp. M-1]
MARRVCLSIGVATVQPPRDQALRFGYLDGAIPAAEAIGNWALQSGFGAENVRVVTDEQGDVTEARVSTVVDELFPQGAEEVDHMILSFVGHGLTDAHVGSMSWLFSDASKARYRIHAASFYEELLRKGMQRLTVLADACREAPKDLDLMRYEAHRGITVDGTKAKFPKVDRLACCQDGQLGFMVKNPRSAARGKCIFSGVIADVLWGLEPDAITNGRITVARFASYVRSRTAERAESYRLALTPDCFVDPDEAVVYDAASPPEGDPSLQPWPSETEVTVMSADVLEDVKTVAEAAFENLQKKPASFGKSVFPFSVELPGLTQRVPLPKSNRRILEDLVVLHEPKGSDGAKKLTQSQRDTEIRQRLEKLEANVVGGARLNIAARLQRRLKSLEKSGIPPANLHVLGKIERIWARGEMPVVDSTPIRKSFRLEADAEGFPIMIEFADGSFAPVVPYPKCTAVAARDDGGEIFQVFGSFRPGRPSGPDPSFRHSAQLVARYAAGKLGPDNIQDIAATLRHGKHEDPILGVLCAYLYQAVADIDSIRRMAFYYADAKQPVPFDIAMLGDMPVARNAGGSLEVRIPEVPGRPDAARKFPRYVTRDTPEAAAPVGGRCPWLGLGWDYVGLVRNNALPLVEELMPLKADISRNGFTLFPRATGHTLAEAWSLSPHLPG